jgi:Lrp/AsnC family transcriptional regulator, leucine-responsive regulatory protein
MQIDQIDDRDRAILRLLMRDGRLTNADLSERVHLSPSACLRRVRQLKESGLIAGYVMLLDPTAAGLPGAAFVFVTLDQQGREALDRFEAEVGRHAEITECYLLAGSADYLLRIAYRDAHDLERIHTDILAQLRGVSRVQSTLTLRTVKKTSELPLCPGRETVRGARDTRQSRGVG